MGFSQRAAAGYPGDLGDPTAFPAGSLQTKPNSLGKSSDAESCVRDREGVDGSPVPASDERITHTAQYEENPTFAPSPQLAGVEHPEFTP